MDAESMRINKYLNGTGYCSRREADRLLSAGRVTVQNRQGEKRTVSVGDRCFAGERVFVDGKEIEDTEEEKLYLMLNKPKGVICTGDRRIPDNIIDFAGLRHYISYAGRLDKDSTGLVLLTNDGELNDKIMRAANYHEKEYIVRVDRPISMSFLSTMRRGVRIILDDDRHLKKENNTSEAEDGQETAKRGVMVTTRPCQVTRLRSCEFSIILTQGYNKQIRRMCQALGYRVLDIRRIRIMNLRLGNLKEGMKRFLMKSEIEELRRLACEPVPEDALIGQVD
ncbi:MAG: pseudouridine synthase [Lachnospiraceae bacterium]